MHTLARNRQRIYYCLHTGETAVKDSNDHDTGERLQTYSSPTELWVNISPASGAVAHEMFGNLDGYDRVLVTEWTECPIDETSVLFIEKDPPDLVGANLDYDYIVRRVAKSINSVAIAVRKVNTK